MCMYEERERERKREKSEKEENNKKYFLLKSNTCLVGKG